MKSYCDQFHHDYELSLIARCVGGGEELLNNYTIGMEMFVDVNFSLFSWLTLDCEIYLRKV